MTGAWIHGIDWSATGAMLSGLATIAVAVLTVFVIFENRQLRKAGNSPRVVIHFEPHPAGNGALQLALSNVGTGPALDVSYSFEYETGDFENYNLLFKYAEERPAMTMIGQGEKFNFIFAIGFRLFQPKDASISKQLRPFHVKVNWRSLGDGQIHSETYLLDIAAYTGLPGLFEKPPIVKIADKLEGIERHLSKLTTSKNICVQSLDITCLEQNTRAARSVNPPDSGEEPN